MPRRLPARALALALALAVAAGVDAGQKLPDCRLFAHYAASNDPGSFPACSLIKNAKLLRINFAPGEASTPVPGESGRSNIRMWDLGRVDRADVPNGLVDLDADFDIGKLDFERFIDEAYGFKTFSKRWRRMRKQGSKKGLPALINGDSTLEVKLNAVKFGKKNGVVFADYQVSKGSRAALASAWGTEIDEAAVRSACNIVYATPCPRLGL